MEFLPAIASLASNHHRSSHSHPSIGQCLSTGRGAVKSGQRSLGHEDIGGPRIPPWQRNPVLPTKFLAPAWVRRRWTPPLIFGAVILGVGWGLAGWSGIPWPRRGVARQRMNGNLRLRYRHG